jgi:hypothetical protein
MAPDWTLFGGEPNVSLPLDSRNLFVRDAIAIPLQRRFARDPLVRGVDRGELANLCLRCLRSIWDEGVLAPSLYCWENLPLLLMLFGPF